MVMTKIRAKRTLAGNIALVIFLAFLTTLTIGLSPALADNVIDPGETTETATTNSLDSLELTVNITPLTSAEFSSTVLKIYKDGVVDKSITVADIYNADPSKVTDTYDPVYGSCYSIVYAWTGLNLDYGTNTGYEFSITKSGTPYQSIDLTIEGPSRPSSGGGGGGVTATPPATETELETTVDSSGNVQAGGTLASTTTDTGEASVTFAVDSEGIENQVADEQVVNVELVVPEQVDDADVAEAAIEVSADTLADVFDADKPVTVKAAGVELELPVDALDLSALTGQDVNITINISKAEEGTTPPPDTAVYEIAGQVYHVSIRAEQDGVDKGSVPLSNPITLTLPYDTSTDVDPGDLSIYRLNEDTNVWESVGGTANTADGTVSVTRSSLSTYTVMAYTGTFTDMVGHWALEDVQLMAARGIIKGMTTTTFVPDTNVTRAQFAALMLRTMEISENSAAGNVFSDVAANAWYAGAVETAAEKGLINGYTDGTFKPDNSITREEMAAVISRALSQSGITSELTDAEVNAKLAVFNDANQIGDWAKASMAQAIEEGIIQGRTAVTSAPKANATRAESAVMLKRFLQSTGII